MPWPTDPAEQYFGRGLWGWATNVWERIKGDGSGALHVHIASQTGTQLIQQMMPTLLKPGIHGYDGSSWQELSLLWGYTDRLAAKAAHTKSGAATYNMDVFTVPANYVYVVNATLSYDAGSAINHRHFLYDGVDYFEVAIFPAQVSGVWGVNANVSYVLKEGDGFRVQFVSAQDGDQLLGRVWGYQMRIG